jgi:hypothetical protein
MADDFSTPPPVTGTPPSVAPRAAVPSAAYQRAMERMTNFETSIAERPSRGAASINNSDAERRNAEFERDTTERRSLDRRRIERLRERERMTPEERRRAFEREMAEERISARLALIASGGNDRSTISPATHENIKRPIPKRSLLEFRIKTDSDSDAESATILAVKLCSRRRRCRFFFRK